MVVIDVGDDRHPEVEGVGGIEPAAEADLANKPIDARCEVCERHAGQHLELGSLADLARDRIENGFQLLEGAHEVSFADRNPIELNPLGV